MLSQRLRWLCRSLCCCRRASRVSRTYSHSGSRVYSVDHLPSVQPDYSIGYPPFFLGSHTASPAHQHWHQCRSSTLVVRGPRAGPTHSLTPVVVLVLSQPPALVLALDIMTSSRHPTSRGTHRRTLSARACCHTWRTTDHDLRLKACETCCTLGNDEGKGWRSASSSSRESAPGGGDKTVVHHQSRGASGAYCGRYHR